MTDLVADVGATHARFQLCDEDGLRGTPIILQTAGYAAVPDLLDDVLQTPGMQEVVLGRSLFAVAGPQASAGGITVTNTGLLFDAAQCSTHLGVEVRLENDFFALAHGVPLFTQLTQLGGASAQPGNKALLGPGSGLGMATIVPVGRGGQGGPGGSGEEERWQVVASEGGHADLAPGSPLEAELWSILAQQHDHVSWETVLCGPGLQRLYVAMCSLWGSAPQDFTPAQISALGQSLEDPVCHQTLESFCGLLGSAAGNLALLVTALGGVYLSGGILPQMRDFVLSSPLRRRFEERGEMSDYVADIPLYLVGDEAPGLLGAWRCLYA